MWDLPRSSSDSTCRYTRLNCWRFSTEYLSKNGRRIISAFSINGSVQFIALYQILGSGFPYIANLWANVESTGWESSSNRNPSSGTPGSSTVTGRWGGRIADSAVNWSVNWDGSVNASPAYLLWSPVNPHVSWHCVHKYFLNHIHQQRLWRQSNCRFFWRRQDRDFSNGTTT